MHDKMPSAVAFNPTQMYSNGTPCQPGQIFTKGRKTAVASGEFVDIGTRLYQLQLQLSKKDSEIKEVHKKFEKYQKILYPDGDTTKPSSLDVLRMKYDVVNEQLLHKQREIRKEKKRSSGLMHDLKAAKKSNYELRKENVSRNKDEKKKDNDTDKESKAVQHRSPHSTRNAFTQCSLLVNRNNSEKNIGRQPTKQRKYVNIEWKDVSTNNEQEQMLDNVVKSESKVRLTESSASIEQITSSRSPLKHHNDIQGYDVMQGQLTNVDVATQNAESLKNNIIVTSSVNLHGTTNNTEERRFVHVNTTSPGQIYETSVNTAAPVRQVITAQVLPPPRTDLADSKRTVLFARSSLSPVSTPTVKEQPTPLKLTITQDIENGTTKTIIQSSQDFQISQTSPLDGARSPSSTSVSLGPFDQPQTLQVTTSHNSPLSVSSKGRMSDSADSGIQLSPQDKFGRSGSPNIPMPRRVVSPKNNNASGKSPRIYEKNLHDYMSRDLYYPGQNQKADATLPYYLFRRQESPKPVTIKDNRPIYVKVSELKITSSRY